MRMRRVLAAAAAAVLTLALAGCATPGGAAPTTSVSPAGTPAPAVDLLSTVWHVHGAAGADAATYLLFSAREVEVLEPKGFVELGWATQGDRMLAMVRGWAMSLGTAHEPTVPWLTAATRFDRAADGWVLRNEDGRTVATLSDDGPAPSQSDTLTTPEPVTSFARASTADAVAPAGARTVASSALVGHWGVAGLDPAHASLTLSADGAWTVDGGCLSGLGDLEGSGDWRVIDGGFLLLTERPVAGVGCATTPAPADAAALERFSGARSVKLSGDLLTLYDVAGTRIGTLTRLG